MLGAGARGIQRDDMGRVVVGGGSGLGTHVHPWRIHVNVGKNQYISFFISLLCYRVNSPVYLLSGRFFCFFASSNSKHTWPYLYILVFSFLWSR